MGRYWNLNNGMEGKFGFGVQGSDDATIFGMKEQSPSYVNYFLNGSEENKENVRKVIDEQYDILHFPQEKRIYTVKKEDELTPLWEEFDSLVYERVERTDKTKGEIGYGGANNWWKKFAPEGFKGNESDFYQQYDIVPRRDIENPVLAECRIVMGIKILSCLETEGYCDMEAEL